MQLHTFVIVLESPRSLLSSFQTLSWVYISKHYLELKFALSVSHANTGLLWTSVTAIFISSVTDVYKRPMWI